MSRLSNSRVRLRVGTQAIDAQLWRGWMRPLRVAQIRQLRNEADAMTGSLFEDLQQALGALALHAPIDGAALHVELADSLLQFDVARGEFGALGDRQLGMLAEASLSELLGEPTGRHVLRWQLQRDERHLLICALPITILQSLQAVAQGSGLRLARVEASFVAHWNRRAIAGLADRAVLAVAGEHHALIASVERGSIVTLWHAALGAAPAQQAAELERQVDSLLASVGRTAVGVTAMLLIDTAGAQRAWSRRWTVSAVGEGRA